MTKTKQLRTRDPRLIKQYNTANELLHDNYTGAVNYLAKKTKEVQDAINSLEKNYRIQRMNMRARAYEIAMNTGYTSVDMLDEVADHIYKQIWIEPEDPAELDVPEVVEPEELKP